MPADHAQYPLLPHNLEHDFRPRVTFSLLESSPNSTCIQKSKRAWLIDISWKIDVVMSFPGRPGDHARVLSTDCNLIEFST